MSGGAGDRGRRSAAVLVLLVVAGTGGCSGDDGGSCSGSTYDPDLGQRGATSPIAALEDWLGTDPELPDPPDGDWVVQDTGAQEPDMVVVRNDGDDGWWVGVARTDPGGWVVEQATNGATGCRDLPTG